MKAWRTALSTIAVVLLLTVQFGARPASDNPNVSVIDKNINVVVSGTIVAVEGVECPVMLFINNYHLVGNLQGFGPGDQVRVTGALDIATICQQGTPLRVISITGI